MASLLCAVAFGCALLIAHADTTLGPNLIANPGLETVGANGLPTGWLKGGYGTNDRTLTYPVTSADGTKAMQVKITSYTNGDAKWYFADVPIKAGSTYQFSDDSVSDVSTIVTARYTMQDGSFSYPDIGTVPAGEQHTVVQFTPPVGAVSMTIFHLIKGAGSLTTDNYSLQEVQATTPPPPPPPPPPPSDNLVPNGNFEQGTVDDPTGWQFDFWGTLSGAYDYPVQGGDGSKAARISVDTYSNGDAKWIFDALALAPGSYTYSDEYNASVTTYIDVQLHNADGTYTYKPVATLPPTSGWKSVSVDFSVPAGTQDVSVFHLIEGVGTLTIDNVSVKQKAPPGGIFTTGAVSLRFDDGETSQIENAVPKMNAKGYKGTFYIVSRQLLDYGFSGYMSINDVKQLAQQGHEIGAHTRTHANLTTLGTSALQDEIAGSRQDILAWGVGPVNTFSYPFGAHNASAVQAVKDAGFKSAAATIEGYVTPTSNPHLLEYRELKNNTTLAQVKQWIDEAKSKKVWVILTFHAVRPDCTGDLYCSTPALFSQILDYLASTNLPVVTISEGRASI